MENILIKKIQKIGNSKGVILDKKILDRFGVNVGDFIQIIIKGVNKK